MKKITYTIATATLGALMFAMPAFAATTASITPTSVKVTAGQRFNVVVSVNPNGTPNYAEQLQIDYPANLLAVSSFTLGSNWMVLSQKGYDSIDNTNGVMVKTAGYAGGITSLTPFGTITFTAKKSGSATISIGSGSQSFEKSGQSAIAGTGAAVTIAAAYVAPKNTPTTNAAPTTQSTTTDLTPVTTINGQVATATNAQVAAAAVAASQAAANSTSSGDMTIIWIIIAIIIVAIVVFLIYKKKGKRSI